MGSFCVRLYQLILEKLIIVKMSLKGSDLCLDTLTLDGHFSLGNVLKLSCKSSELIMINAETILSRSNKIDF